MATYAGVDIGTAMLKAGATGSGSEPPRLLPLDSTTGSPFLPATAKPRTGQGACWELFSLRQCDPKIAFGFRDRSLDPVGSIAIGSGTCKLVDLHAVVFRNLREALNRAAPDLAGVAVTIPDHWPPTAWAMPVALSQDGWNPLLCAPEWAAALAGQETITGGSAIALSVGFGSARATCCTVRDGCWVVSDNASSQTEQVGGSQLRKLLVPSLVEHAIHQLRRDPRESPQTDQALCDGVEKLLQELGKSPSALFEAELFGQRFARQFSRQELVELVKPWRAPLVEMLRGLTKRLSIGPGECQLIVWGELTSLLPLTDWLRPALPSIAEITICDPSILALGAARLSALTAESQLDLAADGFAAIRKDSGQVVPSFTTESRSTAFPLLARLPAKCCTSGGSGAQPRLTRLDCESEPQEMVIGANFRLGRDPRSDWTIEDERDMVSRAHAVIVAEGSQYYIADLGSVNGTFVNERLIQGRQPLNSDDVVTLGQNGPQFRFAVS